MKMIKDFILSYTYIRIILFKIFRVLVIKNHKVYIKYCQKCKKRILPAWVNCNDCDRNKNLKELKK